MMTEEELIEEISKLIWKFEETDRLIGCSILFSNPSRSLCWNGEKFVLEDSQSETDG